MFPCFEAVFSLFHLKRTPPKWKVIHQTYIFKETVLKGLMLDSVVIKPLGSQRNSPQSAVGMYQALDYFVLRAERGEYFCRSLIKSKCLGILGLQKTGVCLSKTPNHAPLPLRPGGAFSH